MKNYSDYNGFDYRQLFWGNHQRDYEDFADKNAIKNLITPATWFLDLGGGFGRLIPSYQKEMKNIILMDGSIELLREAEQEYQNLSNVHFVCAESTHLPFRDQAIDSTLIFRVLHCLDEENLLQTLQELERVINSTVYLEFANKRNLVRIGRYFFGNRETNIFSRKPEQVNGSFFNFTFPYLKKVIKENTSFEIKKITRLSFFRHRWFKKTIPLPILKALETNFQNHWFWNTTPSIILKLSKKNSSHQQAKDKKFLDLIACPLCHHHLQIDQSTITCSHCHQLFFRENKILNFQSK